MDRAEIAELLIKIKRRYPSYQVPENAEQLRGLLDDLLGDLKDVPFERAEKNLHRHVQSGNRFAPTIAELVQPLEPEVSEQERYYTSMRQAGQEYLEKVSEMEQTASPPPEEVRRIMRLPAAERWEALKKYADRKRHERDTART
ncbi:hypothetical protein QJ48_04315 [Paenibacillus sp. A3]|uniref:replicative helicase loader/inhibitor n=1 Tax=Paenibacillus sp. A3 TaxID=1337054 RepID=UPI0006D541C3|nr:replicative helicase loader/inhibitor [Paenibacillus sp. A3]KPV60750.1 hypothetical protein QJ48_04315 [Paenibacillus sp. A3]